MKMTLVKLKKLNLKIYAEFIEESFTDFIETNDLVEEFETELKVEGIEEQFFEELGNEMMAEIGEEMMTEIIELNEPKWKSRRWKSLKKKKLK